MAEILLGIYPAADGAHLAWVRKSMGRCIPVGAAHVDLGGRDLKAPESAEIIVQALHGLGVKPHRAAVVFPDRWVFLRDLILPFGQQAKVARVLPLELEGRLPLAAEELLVDFQILGRTHNQERKWSVLAAAVSRELAADIALNLRNAGLDLEVADTARSACQALLDQSPSSLPERFMLLHFEPAGSTMYLVINGRIRQSRILSSGAWSQSLKAETVAVGLAGGVRQALLARGLEDIQRVVLFGETALLEGDPAPELERSLGIVCQRLSDFRPRPEEMSGTFTLETHALALGGALRLARSGSGCNFLQGELASTGQRVQSGKLALHGLGALAVALFFLFGVMMYQEISLSRRLEAVHAAMAREVDAVVPDGGSRLVPAQYESALQDRVRALQGTGDIGAGSGPPPLEVLLAVSRAMPQEDSARLLQFVMDGERVRCMGRAGDFGAVEGIKTGLERSGLFGQVRIQGVSSDRDGRGVRFTIEMEPKI
jgi:hypothetical protein